jgi:hypothetical protein
LLAAMTWLPHRSRASLAGDQGSEMGHYRDFTVATGCPVYFCDPHNPWQRGSNDNTNGLLRQYFPKGRFDVTTIDQSHLHHVADELNGRPHQTLARRGASRSAEGWAPGCGGATGRWSAGCGGAGCGGATEGWGAGAVVPPGVLRGAQGGRRVRVERRCAARK